MNIKNMFSKFFLSFLIILINIVFIINDMIINNNASLRPDYIYVHNNIKEAYLMQYNVIIDRYNHSVLEKKK